MYLTPLLKRQLGPKLDTPVATRTSDVPEVAAGDVSVGLVPLWRVDYAESLATNLQLPTLGNLEVAEY